MIRAMVASWGGTVYFFCGLVGWLSVGGGGLYFNDRDEIGDIFTRPTNNKTTKKKSEQT